MKWDIGPQFAVLIEVFSDNKEVFPTRPDSIEVQDLKTSTVKQ